MSAAPFPRVIGVGRMFDNERAVLLALERKPTDDELSALHELVRAAVATVADDDASIETSEREAVEPGRALPESAARRVIGSLQADGVVLFKVGEVIRYSEGSTALMRVEAVAPGHGGSVARYWGEQCLGGVCGAYHEDCRAIDAADFITWSFHHKAC